MTDHEIRVALAEAMDFKPDPMAYCAGCMVAMPSCECPKESWYPDPLNNDRDAARLRAWLIRDDTRLFISHNCPSEGLLSGMHPANCVVQFQAKVSSDLGPGRACVNTTDYPDPCARERRALCLAAVQAVGAMKEVRDDGNS